MALDIDELKALVTPGARPKGSGVLGQYFEEVTKTAHGGGKLKTGTLAAALTHTPGVEYDTAGSLQITSITGLTRGQGLLIHTSAAHILTFASGITRHESVQDSGVANTCAVFCVGTNLYDIKWSKVGSGITIPTGLSATAVDNNGFTANWIQVVGAGGYALDLSEFRPQNPTSSAITETGFTANWDESVGNGYVIEVSTTVLNFSTMLQTLDINDGSQTSLVISEDMTVAGGISWRLRTKDGVGGESANSVTDVIAQQSGFSVEAQAAIDRMPNTPSAADQATMALVVDSLVSTGTWSLLDFFALALTDEDNFMTNWVPGYAAGPNMTKAGTSTPTYVANQGFALDGVDQRIETGFMPPGTGNWVLDGAVMGFMLHANPSYPTSNTTVEVAIGAGEAGNANQYMRGHSDATTGLFGYINNVGAQQTVAAGSERTYEPGAIYSVQLLTTDDVVRLQKDGVEIYNVVNLATRILPTVDFELGRRGDANFESTFTHRMAFWGGGDAFNTLNIRTAMDLI